MAIGAQTTEVAIWGARAATNYECSVIEFGMDFSCSGLNAWTILWYDNVPSMHLHAPDFRRSFICFVHQFCILELAIKVLFTDIL
ncbi:hypothetical protein CW304_23975 [Bacillus sp. UFRGS-B20]|nr:hypothetical protein CW304_23975 [Bacillus sp. UFRGS-B20]